MTRLAVARMASHLTAPFARGADLLDLAFQGVGSASEADVAAYDFLEHVARFDRSPQPRYVLTLLRDVSGALALTFDFEDRPPNQAVVAGTTRPLTIPAGALAFDSFVIDLISAADGTSHEGPDVRVLRVHATPALAEGNVPDWFRLTALLGTTARLLWVLGAERAHLRRQLERTADQRHLPRASGFSLDLIGNDLGVPRFPPLPYAPDGSTVALYHLDEPPGAAKAADIMAKYGGPGHDGDNPGGLARAGEPGRFATAFAFRDPGASLVIPAHAEFDLAAGDSFTADCFLKPEAPAAPVGHALLKHAGPDGPIQPGWALSVGDFGRGTPANVRFLVSDGASQVAIFADQALTGDRFHHVAGVIDRQAQEARLYVEGTLVASASIAGLGAIVNAEPVRVGGIPGGAFRGVVDEVRLSRAARSDFHPVTGEADDPYRRRLGLFQRWTLPTPEALLRLLNEAAGPVDGDAEALVLNDRNATLLAGSAALRIFPEVVPRGQSIGPLGELRAVEAEVSGAVADEPPPDPAFLNFHDDPRATYGPSPPPPRPGLPAADSHRMRPVTAKALNRLLGLLAAPTPLEVVSAFDPAAGDLRALGRALILSHPSVPPDRLAALAHRAGFEFVTHRPDGLVYASKAPGDDLELINGSSPPPPSRPGFDLRVGDQFPLKIAPSLPPDTVYHWLTIAEGAGRAALTPRNDLPTVTLVATAPGRLAVKAEARRGRVTATGTRTFRIGPAPLAAGQAIGEDGTLGVDDAVAGDPDPDFDPAYLVNHDDPRASYGADLNNRRMQGSVARRLDALLDLIATTGAAGPLAISRAFVAGAAGLEGVGRALVVSHPAIADPDLAALAHAVGFTYVEIQAAGKVRVLQAAEPFLTVQAPSELSVGETGPVALSPRARPSGIAVGPDTVFVANAGTDTVSAIDPASGLVRGNATIKVGWAPSAIALSPDGSRLYTADARGATLTVIDPATRAVLQSLPIPKGPTALAHHPSKPQLFVACAADLRVIDVDTQALTISKTVGVAASPVALAVAPDGQKLWVALGEANQVLVLDASNINNPGTTIALGGDVRGVALAPDGTRAFATSQAPAGQLALLKVSPPALDTTVAIGGLPGSLLVSDDGATIAVADHDPEAPRVLLLAPDGTLGAAVRLPGEPSALAGRGARVFAAGLGSDTVTVIDLAERGVADTWRLGSGRGERLSWTVRPAATAAASLSSNVAPAVTIRAGAPGPVLIRALDALTDDLAPYTVEVRLKPALEAVGATLGKDQYDRVMNVLNAFHPLGVEVITRALRERVVEVRENLLDAFPAYTFPNFRARGPSPRPATASE